MKKRPPPSTRRWAFRLAFGLVVVPFLTLSAAADPLEDWFLRSCPSEPQAAPESRPVWAWLDELCRKAAARRALEFRGADRPGRVAMVAADCRDWFERNAWRFSKHVTGNDTAWRLLVQTRCVGEAEADVERLASLLGGGAEALAPLRRSGSPSQHN